MLCSTRRKRKISAKFLKYDYMSNGLKIKIDTQSSNDDAQLATKFDFLIERYTLLKDERASN